MSFITSGPEQAFQPASGNEPGWKARFRVPVVRGMRMAAGAPARGLVATQLEHHELMLRFAGRIIGAPGSSRPSAV